MGQKVILGCQVFDFLGNMNRIYAIALNTFREAVRDRILYGLLGFASAVLLFSLALAELSLNQQQRVVRDIGLASISLFSVLVAIFLGSSLLYKEIERKTLYIILPKPIHRYEFLLCKYFGITLTGLVFVSIMGAIQFWVMAIQAGVAKHLIFGLPVALLAMLGIAMWRARDRTAVLIPWSLLAVASAAWTFYQAAQSPLPVLAMLVLVIAEVMVLAAVAMVFSSFSTPFLTGVFTLGAWIVGRSAHEMATMKSKVLAPSLRTLLRYLAEVVPNFSLYVPGYRTLSLNTEDGAGPLTYVASTLGYTVLYATLLLALAALIFRRRDFL